jgi:proteic killer suppression protein
MIRTFKDKRTSVVHEGESVKGLDGKIQQRGRAKLKCLGAGHDLRDLMIPPSTQLEALKGDRLGQYSLRINRQWRSCFRWESGDAFDVDIVDYH